MTVGLPGGEPVAQAKAQIGIRGYIGNCGYSAGDGQSTFALPDLRGRIPIHQGNGFILAETGGGEEITLTVNQIPAHSHPQRASAATATQNAPATNVFAQAATVDAYVTSGPFVPLNSQSNAPLAEVSRTTNFQPYLCVDFIISLFGIFPSPT